MSFNSADVPVNLAHIRFNSNRFGERNFNDSRCGFFISRNFAARLGSVGSNHTETEER